VTGTVRIGTSGWSYPHWRRGVFYPEGLLQRAEADFARASFPTLELNATFYRLPKPTTVERWRDEAPTGFVYAAKGSRFITHLKRLTNLGPAVDRYLERIAPLEPVMDVVLWQLPPDLERDLPRLTHFLDHVAGRFANIDTRHAVEFRHPSWLDDEVHAALAERGVATTWISSLRMPFRPVTTTDLAYVRFHGLEGGFSHAYTDAELAPVAAAVTESAEAGRDVYVYFNNDGLGRAPHDARRFAELVGPELVSPPPSDLAEVR
jgi:uncharacterized protein YecE (DUF72 family)